MWYSFERFHARYDFITLRIVNLWEVGIILMTSQLFNHFISNLQLGKTENTKVANYKNKNWKKFNNIKSKIKTQCLQQWSHVSVFHPSFIATCCRDLFYYWKYQQWSTWECYWKRITENLLKSHLTKALYFLYFLYFRNTFANEKNWRCFQALCTTAYQPSIGFSMCKR